MHGRQTRRPTDSTTRSALRRPSGAITWIDRTSAIVAHTRPAGAIDVARIRADDPAMSGPFLAAVARRIGDCDRVLILGPDVMRTELEREYVTITHRPDRLVDVEPEGPMTEEQLIERLKMFAG